MAAMSELERQRVEDGTLFKSERVVQLLDLVRDLVFKSIGGAWRDYGGTPAYGAIMDKMHQWHADVAQEETRAALAVKTPIAFADMLRFAAIDCVKTLYRGTGAAGLKLMRPDPERFLRGVFMRLTDPTAAYGIRDGRFFGLTPEVQYHVLRSVFRTALAQDACETYIDTSKTGADVNAALAAAGGGLLAATTAHSVLAMRAHAEARADARVDAARAGAGVDEDGVPRDEVYPDDSASGIVPRGGPATAADMRAEEDARRRLEEAVAAATATTAREDDLRSHASRPARFGGGGAFGSGGSHVSARSEARSQISRVSRKGVPQILETGGGVSGGVGVGGGGGEVRRVVLDPEGSSHVSSRVPSSDRRKADSDAASTTSHSTRTTKTTTDT